MGNQPFQGYMRLKSGHVTKHSPFWGPLTYIHMACLRARKFCKVIKLGDTIITGSNMPPALEVSSYAKIFAPEMPMWCLFVVANLLVLFTSNPSTGIIQYKVVQQNQLHQSLTTT